MLCCPITSHAKGYPFEVTLRGISTDGVVLSDQVKSVDWKARQAEFKEMTSPTLVRDVLAKASTLLTP